MLSATNHSNRENSGFIQCRKIFQNGLQAPAYLFPDKCTLTLYHSVPISLGQQSPKDQQNLFTWHGYYLLAGNFTPFLHWSMASIFSSISWLSALASICIGHASISFPSSFSIFLSMRDSKYSLKQNKFTVYQYSNFPILCLGTDISDNTGWKHVCNFSSQPSRYLSFPNGGKKKSQCISIIKWALTKQHTY